MALFGFAINFNSGTTEFVVLSAGTLQQAQDELDGFCEGQEVESTTEYSVEAIVTEQYRGMAFLTTEYFSGDD